MAVNLVMEDCKYTTSHSVLIVNSANTLPTDGKYNFLPLGFSVLNLSVDEIEQMKDNQTSPTIIPSSQDTVLYHTATASQVASAELQVSQPSQSSQPSTP